MSEVPQDQGSLIKNQFLTDFFKKYGDLVEFVNNLPIHQQFKLNAITRCDEFMFWVREGIVHIKTAIPEGEPNPPVSEPTLLQ
jgi:hypothetical protein